METRVGEAPPPPRPRPPTTILRRDAPDELGDAVEARLEGERRIFGAWPDVDEGTAKGSRANPHRHRARPTTTNVFAAQESGTRRKAGRVENKSARGGALQHGCEVVRRLFYGASATFAVSNVRSGAEDVRAGGWADVMWPLALCFPTLPSAS